MELSKMKKPKGIKYELNLKKTKVVDPLKSNNGGKVLVKNYSSYNSNKSNKLARHKYTEVENTNSSGEAIASLENGNSNNNENNKNNITKKMNKCDDNILNVFSNLINQIQALVISSKEQIITEDGNNINLKRNLSLIESNNNSKPPLKNKKQLSAELDINLNRLYCNGNQSNTSINNISNGGGEFLLNEIDNIYSNANRLKDNISLTNTETQSSYDINNPQLNQELDNIVKNSESCINSYKRLFNKCAMELKEISNIMISNINDSANEQPLLTAMNYLNSNINNTENGQKWKITFKTIKSI